ncbi:MAG TPA: hypothetical protein PKY25_03125 [Bacilli bacterium]|nr:hypothetical protein [Bacilli bacterium]
MIDLESNENSNEEEVVIKKGNNNKKILIIIIIILAVILLAVVAFYNQSYLKKLFNFGSSNTTTTTTKVTTTKDTSWYTPTGNAKKLYIYNYADEECFSVAANSEHLIEYEDVKKVEVYNCKYSKCTGYDANYRYALVKDGTYYYIYDYISNKIKEIKIETKYKKANIAYYKDTIYGIVFGDNIFYSLDDKKIYLNKEYEEINLNEDYYGDILLTKGNVIVRNKNEDADNNYTYDEYIVNYKTGSVKITSKNGTYGIFSVIGNSNTIYYLKSIYININDDEGNYSGEEFYKIYNENYKLLFNGKMFSFVGINEVGNLILENGKAFSTYTSSGKLIKTSKEYNDIKNIFNKYLIVVDTDNYLKLIDDNGVVVKKFFEYKSNMEFFAYYTYDEFLKTVIFNIEETFDEEEDGNIDESTSYQYVYDLNTKKLNKYIQEY